MPFWLGFFPSFSLPRRIFGQNSGFLILWENSENQFGRSKKEVDKMFEFFDNPPRKNPESSLIFSQYISQNTHQGN